MVAQSVRSQWLASSLLVLFLTAPMPLYSGELKASSSIAPDAKIQTLIRRVIDKKGEDDKGGREAMSHLKEMTRKTPQTIVPQLIHRIVHTTDEKEGWRVLGIMYWLGLDYSGNVRTTLIPLLESKEEPIRRETTRWLFQIDQGSYIDIDSNIMFYRKPLLLRKEAPPSGLVNYVFDVAPSKALLLFGDIYSEEPKFGVFPRPLMWSDHVIKTVKWRLRNRFLQDGDLEKAQSVMDDLSKHDGWYARRYVVEVMRNIPKLGTPEILDRLKKDPNPLVSEPAKLVK